MIPDRQHILRLISIADGWRREHRAAKRSIEAAACEIRVQALYDALGEKRPKIKD